MWKHIQQCKYAEWQLDRYFNSTVMKVYCLMYHWELWLNDKNTWKNMIWTVPSFSCSAVLRDWSACKIILPASSLPFKNLLNTLSLYRQKNILRYYSKSLLLTNGFIWLRKQFVNYYWRYWRYYLKNYLWVWMCVINWPFIQAVSQDTRIQLSRDPIENKQLGEWMDDLCTIFQLFWSHMIDFHEKHASQMSFFFPHI